MIACVDVDYRDSGAVAACVVFENWTDAQPVEEAVVTIADVQSYEPGQFFRRELPCLMPVLDAIAAKPEIILIDGYVWLGDERDPGLGAHLFKALGKRVAVIGVAKTKFVSARLVEEVCRGSSHSPLYITAAGMDLSEAARRIQEMHGEFRIPTLLKRVDQLSRGHAKPN